jgi:hypothetical protein
MLPYEKYQLPLHLKEKLQLVEELEREQTWVFQGIVPR